MVWILCFRKIIDLWWFHGKIVNQNIHTHELLYMGFFSDGVDKFIDRILGFSFVRIHNSKTNSNATDIKP